MKDEIKDILRAVRQTKSLSQEAKKKLLKQLIFELIDETDGPGPDGIVDPIAKAIANLLIEELL